MNLPRLLVFPLALAALASALPAQEAAVPVRPAEPVAPTPRPAFTYSFGSMPAADSGASCSVQATGAKGSAEKGHQLKFVLDRKGTPGANGFTFQYFTLSTGRSKSVAQVQALFADAFARAASAPAGAELAKLGDIRFGGEVRAVSLGGGGVELAYNPAMNSGNPRLTPGEAAAFAQILR